MRNPRVAAILARIAGAGNRGGTLLDRLCTECQSTLPISGASVALTTTGWRDGLMLAATDRRSRQLEASQAALAEGPGVDAARACRPLLEPDLSTAGPVHWPRFCKAMLPAGIRAVFAFPLIDGAGCLGILTLYRDTPGRLTKLDLADALAFADAATAILTHLRDSCEIDDDLLTVGPDGGRVVAHQATGMITVQLGITVAEAAQRLRAHAYASGRTVADVAADVVYRRLSFGDTSGRPQPRINPE